MSISLENFYEILNDDTLLFEEDIKIYPTTEQINYYRQMHPHYNGKHVEIWSLYFEIIEHLVGRKFAGTIDEENVMKLSITNDPTICKFSDKHDVKYISLLFSILSNKVSHKLSNNIDICNEWEMLLNYTSMCLPTQIHNMLCDKEKSKLFGEYNIRNLPMENRIMMEEMLKTKIHI